MANRTPKTLPERVANLLQDAASNGNPIRDFCMIEEELKLSEIGWVQEFLNWTEKHRLTYGRNVGEVYAMWRSNDTAALKAYKRYLNTNLAALQTERGWNRD